MSWGTKEGGGGGGRPSGRKEAGARTEGATHWEQGWGDYWVGGIDAYQA